MHSFKSIHLSICILPNFISSCIGDVIRKNGEYGISGKLNIDRNSPYSVVARLKIDNEANTLTYTPTFELEAPSIKPISIKGIFSTKGFKQSDIEVDVNGLTDQPVTAKSKLVTLITECMYNVYMLKLGKYL